MSDTPEQHSSELDHTAACKATFIWLASNSVIKICAEIHYLPQNAYACCPPRTYAYNWRGFTSMSVHIVLILSSSPDGLNLNMSNKAKAVFYPPFVHWHACVLVRNLSWSCEWLRTTYIFVLHVFPSRRASRTTDTYGDSCNQYLFQESLTRGRTATICTGSAYCHRFCTGYLISWLG